MYVAFFLHFPCRLIMILLLVWWVTSVPVRQKVSVLFKCTYFVLRNKLSNKAFIALLELGLCASHFTDQGSRNK